MPPAIEVDRLSVSDGGTEILHSVSFSVSPGEFVLLSGPNGAGKTHLLRALLGVGGDARGVVRLFGVVPSGANRRLVNRRIGYVPQILAVDPGVPATAEEVVLMGRYAHQGLLRRPSLSDRTAARQLLELLGVSHRAQVPFGLLSGGERQRVLLCRALAGEPEMLFLDEPFSSLDRPSVPAVSSLLCDFYGRRTLTVLLVAHGATACDSVATRRIELEDGRVASDRTLTNGKKAS